MLDTESAAGAHVAYANGVFFIAFQFHSDLGGDGESENAMATFMCLVLSNSAKVVEGLLGAMSEG